MHAKASGSAATNSKSTGFLSGLQVAVISCPIYEDCSGLWGFVELGDRAGYPEAASIHAKMAWRDGIGAPGQDSRH